MDKPVDSVRAQVFAPVQSGSVGPSGPFTGSAGLPPLGSVVGYVNPAPYSSAVVVPDRSIVVEIRS